MKIVSLKYPEFVRRSTWWRDAVSYQLALTWFWFKIWLISIGIPITLILADAIWRNYFK